VIADGNAMGIAAQIAKHRRWTCHRLLDIDDPVFLVQRLKKSPECLGIFQRPGGAAEAELVSAIGPFQSVEELATTNFLENTERKKEAIPRLYPMAAMGGKATDWHEAVDVWMEKQVLAPTVQDGEEPDLGAEVLLGSAGSGRS